MKYALVTGASRGIGKAVALRLAAAGWPVVINFLSNKDAAQQVVDEIAANGGTAELLPFDTSDPKAIETALSQWETAHPEDWFGCLVNNAGIRRDNAMFMMSDEDWHRVLDTTLNGYFYITRQASLSGVKGLPGQANYSAAKAAIIGATKSLAQEVGPRNITVNAIAPGFIETDMTKDLPVDDLKKMIPAGRFGKPEEVAALAAFLASDEAGYITGEVININGGLYT